MSIALERILDRAAASSVSMEISTTGRHTLNAVSNALYHVAVDLQKPMNNIHSIKFTFNATAQYLGLQVARDTFAAFAKMLALHTL
eukprot:1103971-Rhodomonas_salina.1